MYIITKLLAPATSKMTNRGVTMTDIVRVLESDFQEVKNDKKTSQEDLK